MNSDILIKELITKLVLIDNYWGLLFSNIKRIESTEIPCFAVGFDKNLDLVLYYNSNRIYKFNDKDLVKILEHEGFHILNGHLIKMNKMISDFSMDDDLYIKKKLIERCNIASDISVNFLCKMPESLVDLDGERFECESAKKYNFEDGKQFEYYFSKLEDQENNKKNKSDNNDRDGSKSKSIGNKFDKIIGSHLFWENNFLSDDTTKLYEIENNIKDLANEALKSVRDRGNLPKNILQTLDNLFEPPVLPYYLLVRKYVRSFRQEKRKKAYSRVNKKRAFLFYEPDFIILPFPYTEKDNSFYISIILDTSRSISNDFIKQSLAGIKDIIENDRFCKTVVIENDTSVKKEYIVKKVSDIDFNIKGRGGTILSPALKRSKELNVDAALVFTDGYCEDINKINVKDLPRKILWIIPENGIENHIGDVGIIIKSKKSN